MGIWADRYGHKPEKIDLDRGMRGCTLEVGGRVWMYKDMPGLFIDQSGHEVPDEIARQKFDVDGLRKEANIRFRIADATETIRAEADAAEVKIRAEVEAEVEAEESTNPFNVPVEDAHVEAPQPATDFNAKGEPRGTAHYVMKYTGGSFWSVVERASEDVMINKVKGRQAIDEMFRLEQVHNDIATAVAS